MMEYEEVLALIEAGRYISASDFVREAIRDKLKSTEIIKLRDITYGAAKKKFWAIIENMMKPTYLKLLMTWSWIFNWSIV